jgi:hypothetical protein
MGSMPSPSTAAEWTDALAEKPREGVVVETEACDSAGPVLAASLIWTGRAWTTPLGQAVTYTPTRWRYRDYAASHF